MLRITSEKIWIMISGGSAIFKVLFNFLETTLCKEILWKHLVETCCCCWRENEQRGVLNRRRQFLVSDGKKSIRHQFVRLHKSGTKILYLVRLKCYIRIRINLLRRRLRRLHNGTTAFAFRNDVIFMNQHHHSRNVLFTVWVLSSDSFSRYINNHGHPDCWSLTLVVARIGKITTRVYLWLGF